jgi:hypothetical protein
MAADTSSAPADSNPVVRAAAAAFAVLSADPIPIPSKSEAAAESISGATITNDM